jgi:hypothetical protein
MLLWFKKIKKDVVLTEDSNQERLLIITVDRDNDIG